MKSEVMRTIAAEGRKLRRLKATFILPAVTAAAAGIQVTIFELIERRTLAGPPSGYYVSAETIAWLSNMIAVVAVVVTSFLISREFALGTVKSTWIRPIRRERWYAGKVLTAAAAVSFLYVLAASVVVAIAYLRVGMEDLVVTRLVLHTSGDLAARLGISLGLTLVVLWAVVCASALVASFVDSVGGAIAAGLGLGVLLGVLQLSSLVRPFLINNYLGAPLSQMMSMARGLPTPYEWNTLTWQALACAAVWAIVTYAAGRWLIRRREITS